ncbi:hypothetical protein BH09PLA1_BH09PLA1_34180 [soil metagenome]
MWAVVRDLVHSRWRKRVSRDYPSCRSDYSQRVLPVILLLPLLFIGLAWLIDQCASPWGTRIVGGLHVLLIAICFVGIIYGLRRMRAARRRVVEC